LDTIIKTKPVKYHPLWLWKMAWRDSRKKLNQLILYISSISIGIAALVGLNAFKFNLSNEINNQAKTLLGADLVVEMNQPPNEEVSNLLDSIGDEKSMQCRFASMIYFPRTQGARLVQVRALKGDYPYYGAIETVPYQASMNFQNDSTALVDETLMMQYDVETGDIIKIGKLSFQIAGKIQNVPGQSGVITSVAPVVYMPYQYLKESGLIQKGSRFTYSYFYKYDNQNMAKESIDKYGDRLSNLALRYEDVEKRKENTSRAFKDLSGFLDLTAIVALLLGCLGVSSAIRIYLKGKHHSIAILRCLGLKSGQVFSIFFIQVVLLGIIGSSIGVVIGLLIQGYLPIVLKDFIPVEMDFHMSWQSVLAGYVTGIIVTVLFAYASLFRLKKISPLKSLRASFEHEDKPNSKFVALYFSLVILFVYSVILWQTRDVEIAAWYIGGTFVSFSSIALFGKAIIWILKKVDKSSWPFVVKQSISNLYRPNNQTLLLVVSIGLGGAMIATLYFIQFMLLAEVQIAGAGDRPNVILFDIQTSQKEEIKEMTLDYNLPVIQEVPIVTMRLRSINGNTKNDAEEDSTINIPNWVFNREYRVTYRDSLIDSEKLVEGEMKKNNGDSIFISVSKGYAENMDLRLGDEIIFNVQGAILKTYVGSFRDIDWNRVQTNFIIVFPEDVLEEAPQFHVLLTKVSSNNLSARYQQAVVRGYPNISIIDLELILKTLDDLLGKISFVIEFMALFSLLIGIMVLLSTIILSKFQRLQEAVLLRTLGANKIKLLLINGLEYFFIGLISSISGILVALIINRTFGYYVFDSNYFPGIITVLIIASSLTMVTTIMGVVNNISMLKKTPLSILRNIE